MSENSSVNLKKGVSFEFEDAGYKIIFKSSPYSGLEEVFVNGELATSKKSYSKNSTLNFDIEADAYSLVLEVVSMLKGPIICTLNKNGIPQKKKQIVCKLPEDKGTYKKYAIGALLGIIFVVIKIYWDLPFVSFIYFLGAVFVFFFIFEALKQEDPEFLLEDVEIK